MNYVNTFIRVAPDTKVEESAVPVAKGGKKTVAVLEYELISENPYVYTQEEVQFAVYAARHDLSASELKIHHNELWQEFFSKPRACMRTSPLARTYGWGLHFNAAGKVAIVAMESAEYKRLANKQSIEQTHAMRTKRA